MKDSENSIIDIGYGLSIQSVTLSDCGLLAGKAGVGLLLFELAKHTGHQKFESHAFRLIEESLITQCDQRKSIEVGYVLLYLINNHFIDADFEEVFGSAHQEITKTCEQSTDLISVGMQRCYKAQYARLKGGKDECLFEIPTSSRIKSYLAEFAEHRKTLSVESAINSPSKYFRSVVEKAQVVLISYLAVEQNNPKRLSELLSLL